ncbi:hypothetical protein DRE_04828 [Drechslerella stenobrocha 248]|uniref:Copper acquisition factor BIM1-like domain-containing protein n=1 Tax=Drechslerella stenobrocha 248 TaxID=1043628 RepID=W7IAG2_9PEZI|nr:hypothetical protein DRE_04828 [Drechslerella stenobrocha 248]
MLLQSTLLLLPLASAHFLLNSPPTIGFSDDDQGVYPCGSFKADDRKSVTEFPSGGIPISVTSTHPKDVWFYRAALLNDTEGWVDLSPAITQTGTGEFCTTIKGPSAWEGEDGVLQIIASAPDGFLFQCAAVKFVGGEATAPDGKCKNGTRVSGSFTPERLVLNAQETSTGVAGPQSTRAASGISNPPSPSATTPPSGSGAPNAAGLNKGKASAVFGGIVGAIGLLFI